MTISKQFLAEIVTKLNAADYKARQISGQERRGISRHEKIMLLRSELRSLREITAIIKAGNRAHSHMYALINAEQRAKKELDEMENQNDKN
mgnify:CR=1 FL=1